jgi:[ribosomal protein S5]-alanine N-acetyltransferase
MKTKRPPFGDFPVLSDGRIILRELTAGTAGLEEILTYDGRHVTSEAEIQAVLEKIRNNYTFGSAVNWGVFSAETNELAGTCGYYRGFENRQGEIGFILRESYREKGYMSAALKLVVAFGLETMQLQRVIAITQKTNDAAKQVLGRNGFIYVKELEKGYIELEYRDDSVHENAGL